MTEKKTYILDGNAFWTLKGFAEHFSNVVLEDYRWGGNLDGLNDSAGAHFDHGPRRQTSRRWR